MFYISILDGDCVKCKAENCNCVNNNDNCISCMQGYKLYMIGSNRTCTIGEGNAGEIINAYLVILIFVVINLLLI